VTFFQWEEAMRSAARDEGRKLSLDARLYDEDGLDAPFAKAIERAIREDRAAAKRAKGMA
jgi:hypothetical protein